VDDVRFWLLGDSTGKAKEGRGKGGEKKRTCFWGGRLCLLILRDPCERNTYAHCEMDIVQHGHGTPDAFDSTDKLTGFSCSDWAGRLLPGHKIQEIIVLVRRERYQRFESHLSTEHAGGLVDPGMHWSRPLIPEIFDSPAS
jgi:hypothetical protein